MPPIYWLPISFLVFMSLTIAGVHWYMQWYYRKYGDYGETIDIIDTVSPFKAKDILKQILPYRLHCRLGLHTPTVMIHSVTHERTEDICLECGKKLAVYKTIKVKPKNTGIKRGLF